MAILPSRPAPAEISAEEWEVRVELAALYRLFVRYGWTDLIYTHISARVPGEPEHYLINPYGLLFDEVTASNLIKVNFEGEVVAGDFPYNDAGHAIHSAVLKARPDMHFALHSHTRAGMAVAAMKCGLLPLTQHAMTVMEQVAYHEWDLVGESEEECERMAADLGEMDEVSVEEHAGILGLSRATSYRKLQQALAALPANFAVGSLETTLVGSDAPSTIPPCEKLLVRWKGVYR